MPIVTGIKFRGTGKQYYFSPRDIKHLSEGDRVIVETARGRELGEVVSVPHEVEEGQVVGRLKPVVRKAGPADLLAAERYQLQEDDAVVTCQEQVDAAGLKMKIVRGEYNFDGSRLTFYFTSEKRVDFRKLVRDLARLYKTRIELRQIGVRDEAKMITGVGKCGRPLCCSTWLQEFKPVSIKMAKNQDLPLSPMEISGLCGRLLCCLTYEDDMYRTVKKTFPRQGKIVDTPLGPARVLKIKVFDSLAVLRLENGELVEMTAGQITGDEPYVPVEKADDDGRGHGLDEALQANRRHSQSGRASRQSGSSNQGQSRSSRSRRRRKSSSSPRSNGQSRSGGQQEATAKQGGQKGQSPKATQAGGGSEQSATSGASSKASSRSRSKRRRRRRPSSRQGGQQASSGDGPAPSGSSSGNKGQGGQSGGSGQSRSQGQSRSSSSRRRSRSSSRSRAQGGQSSRPSGGSNGGQRSTKAPAAKSGDSQ